MKSRKDPNYLGRSSGRDLSESVNRLQEVESAVNCKIDFENDFVTADIVASYLRCHVNHVRNLTSNGKIVHYKFGRSVRYNLLQIKLEILKNKQGISNGN